MKNKNPIALQIAKNLHIQLNIFKKNKGIVTNSVGQVVEGGHFCPCCNQSLPHPYTQEWLGGECGMTKATIVHYFQGNRIPSVVNMLKVAKVLECTLDQLLEGVDPSMLPEDKS